MALLHRCVPPVALAASLNAKGTTVSQCRPALVCFATPSDGEGGAVFKDDSTGIVCFSNEDGEIICEGWDEGPHFQPEPGKGYTMRKKVSTRRPGNREGEGGGESFKSMGAKLQESISEVTAESSFNSSEL